MGATDCSNFRTISFLSYASKIGRGILKKRITSKSDGYLGKDQYGFRKGSGTREAIVAKRIICKRSLEHNLEISSCFVDFEKVLARIRWDKLHVIKILKK